MQSHTVCIHTVLANPTQTHMHGPATKIKYTDTVFLAGTLSFMRSHTVCIHTVLANANSVRYIMKYWNTSYSRLLVAAFQPALGHPELCPQDGNGPYISWWMEGALPCAKSYVLICFVADTPTRTHLHTHTHTHTLTHPHPHPPPHTHHTHPTAHPPTNTHRQRSRAVK